MGLVISILWGILWEYMFKGNFVIFEGGKDKKDNLPPASGKKSFLSSLSFLGWQKVFFKKYPQTKNKRQMSKSLSVLV